MGKIIEISTEVFSRLWGLRQEHEENEDEILRRILSQYASSIEGEMEKKIRELGITEQGVQFTEGFEVHRNYLGKSYNPRVINGAWFIPELNESFKSLNEMSRRIGAKTENAWRGWHYRDKNNISYPALKLRNPNNIRKKRNYEENTKIKEREGGVMPAATYRKTWADDLVVALENIGGEGYLHSIYKEVERIRRTAGRSVPPSFEATVRRTLEDHSSDSDNFRGRDLFQMKLGKGAGFWALRRNN